MHYDVVIIGSGLGGLLCANLLSRQGMKVCLLEKNKQFGGNLQTFSRDRRIFDTGVHYIGALETGQTLHQIFKYAGVVDLLKMEKMDECFDKILIGADETVYGLYQGYPAFIKNLAFLFPDEKQNIIAYCDRIKEVCASFPLYTLFLDRNIDAKLYKGTDESAKAVIASFTTNKKLQAVLAGNNILYAGDAGTTPFHVHALVTNSYIESSWKCIGGGSQIAKALVASVRQHGGEIMRNTTVTSIEEQQGKVSHVTTGNGLHISGDCFISNIHPSATIEMTHSALLKSLYKKRIVSLQQTISSFSLHIVLKKKSMLYENCNYYYHEEGELWNMSRYTKNNWPLGYGLYFTEDRKNKGFASSVSILTPMRFEEVEPWAHTCNRVGKECSRGKEYEAFKKQKAEKLLTLVGKRFPEIVNNMRQYCTSSPLTNRDYIGDATGSMYGIQKDYQNPMHTMISPKTRIPNLFLTGQNVHLHGILGTSLSAVLTCSIILDNDALVDDIRNG